MSKVPIKVRSFRTDAVDCKQAVGKDFENIMRSQAPNLWCGGDTYNKHEGCFRFPNGSEYYFSGCDPARLHGYRQHIAHLDECTKIPYDAWKQIAMRTSHRMIYTFNPEAQKHWIFDYVLDGKPKEQVEYIHSTYKDNPYLTKETIDEIESTNPALGLPTADPWYWQVYGLGKRARREGAIYNRWEITEEWPAKETCQRFGYGLDFGFSIDPSALIECALHQDFLYVREIFYNTGLTTLRAMDNPNTPCIQNELEKNEIRKSDKIVADSAQPESIASLRNCGYNVIGAKKGRGSVLDGIDKVRQFRLRVHHSAMNIQNELQNYVWKTDNRTKEASSVPIDKHNHALDAIRYWAMHELDQNRILGRNDVWQDLCNIKFESDF